jgi:hypothetical protein
MRFNSTLGVMKRSLQAIIAVLSLLPLAVGILGFIYGAGLFLPEGTATPRLDSQYRFMSAWDIGLAVIVWWIIPRIEYETALFRIVSAAVFFGGVGRLVAWHITGSPGVAFLAVMVIELLVPLLVPWQARLARHLQAASGSGSR